LTGKWVGSIFHFPTGKVIPEEALSVEEDMNVLKLIDSLRTAVSEGQVRKIMVTMLAEGNNPVYLWCNLDNDSMRFIGEWMAKKANDIDEYLKFRGLEKESGIDYEHKRQ
jgi:hypothetical protein